MYTEFIQYFVFNKKNKNEHVGIILQKKKLLLTKGFNQKYIIVEA